MRRVFIAFVAACSLTSPGVFGQTPAATGRVLKGLSLSEFLRARLRSKARQSGYPVLWFLKRKRTRTATTHSRQSLSGTYRIEAFLSGLDAAQSISVEAGKIVRAELQLKPADVKSSVTVNCNSVRDERPRSF